MITLQQAIELVPHWKSSDVDISPLDEGITNNSFLVTDNSESYVLRINHANSQALGLDRRREFKILWFAHAAGLGAEPVYIDNGLLVTRWIEGTHLTPQDLDSVVTIRRIVKILRQIHAWSITGPRISMTQTAARYLRVASKDKREQLKDVVQEIATIVGQLDKHPNASCMCHNDPLHSNFVDGEKLHLIDWEYSAWGDPLFDLATLAYYHEFEPEQVELLLSEYFSHVSSSERQAFDLNVMLTRCLSLLWSEAVAAKN